MKTFDCPKCGAPVTYDPNIAGETAHCSYCQSQLALPDEYRGQPARVLEQIQINVGPQIASGARKIVSLFLLIPFLIVVIVMVTVLAIFGMVGNIVKSVTAPFKGGPFISRPSGSRPGDAANNFATEVSRFGREGIGPGMMTDARSIAVDGKGNFYVGEYSGGRIQVFDSSGNFVTQWVADPKMPLRGLAVDRKGTVYVAQHGNINRYEGDNGRSLGQMDYGEGSGFDDVIATPDGGLLCAFYRGSDDIVRFGNDGRVVRTIKNAVSSAADRSELNTRVAIDGLGNIYALGGFTNAVFKFRSDGKFLNRIGAPGHQPGQISGASAIAVDGKGRVFVSDTKGVQVFDSDGRYLAVFKPEGVASGMAFNDKNELLIVSRNKVMKFVLNQ
jgi:streptogramin lyase